MALFTARFKLSPAGFFGLPDGEKVVVPASPKGREVIGPVLDTRSGVLVNHGSLPEYRPDAGALKLSLGLGGINIEVHDNFLGLKTDSATAQTAYEHLSRVADTIAQILSVQHGTRFSAEFLLLDNEAGIPQRIRQTSVIAMMNATYYNLTEMHERLSSALPWSMRLDERARKALLYFEHACLQHEFAQTLPFLGPHAAFSHALAFLQLFKALVVLVGEPGVDSDYQSRARQLGLPADFWQARVKPLYDVRNDEDVAHYTLADPAPGAILQRFNEAAAVLRQAFVAYMSSFNSARRSSQGHR